MVVRKIHDPYETMSIVRPVLLPVRGLGQCPMDVSLVVLVRRGRIVDLWVRLRREAVWCF